MIKCIYVSIILFCSTSVFSASISAKLVGDKFQIINGRSDGKFITPNFFDEGFGILKTKKWVPGTFASSQDSLILTSKDGNTVTLPAILTGVTYLQLNSYTTEAISGGFGVANCSRFIKARETTVSNEGHPGFCIANESFILKVPSKPFEKYKPILSLEKNNVINAFKSKPSGVYSGTISGVMRYGFIVNAEGNALTYRNIPVTFSLQIQYESNVINNITVLGNGHISPQYNTLAHTAKGSTGYKITANGYFDEGIRFRFVTKNSDDYTLKSVTGGVKDIPYSIECLGCANTLLIDKGNEVNPKTWNEVKGIGNSIPFNLKIFYDDVSVNDVNEDIYRDNFTLMLEPIL